MRGGKRNGAGRKVGSTKTNNRKKISITLPMVLVEKLKVGSISQSKIIEKALNLYWADTSLRTMSDDELEESHNEIVDELKDRGLLADTEQNDIAKAALAVEECFWRAFPVKEGRPLFFREQIEGLRNVLQKNGLQPAFGDDWIKILKAAK